MSKGLFITVEGGDGSGKTTQLGYMKEFFAERSVDVIFTREPGGTAIGEKIRDMILDPKNREMGGMTEALLYAAARSQHVLQVIGPALAEGKVVVCDRFVDSSIVYQGAGRGLGKAVSVINDYAVDGVMPDVTFLFKLDPDEGRKRLRQKEPDRIESEDRDFHRKVYDAYLDLERSHPRRIIGIDGNRDPEEIRVEMISYLDRLLDGYSEALVK